MRRKLMGLMVLVGATCSISGACNDWIDQMQGQDGQFAEFGQRLDEWWLDVQDLLNGDG